MFRCEKCGAAWCKRCLRDGKYPDKVYRADNLCPACGAQNAPGVKFCQECGNKLKTESTGICPACGKENPVGTRFCGDCGERLEA